MNPCPDAATWETLAKDELDDDRSGPLWVHLDHCADCRARFGWAEAFFCGSVWFPYLTLRIAV